MLVPFDAAGKLLVATAHHQWEVVKKVRRPRPPAYSCQSSLWRTAAAAVG